MSATIQLNDAGIKQITGGLTRAMNNCYPFFQKLANEVHQATMLTFRTEGERAGHPKWRGFSQKTLTTAIGTMKIRYGTDKAPERNRQELAEYKKKIGWGFGDSGFMPDYKSARRYGPDSKLLQASGSFRDSFGFPYGIYEVTGNGMKYGTNYHSKVNRGVTAKDIIGDREVLFLMPQDYIKIKKDFLSFVKAGIKI